MDIAYHCDHTSVFYVYCYGSLNINDLILSVDRSWPDLPISFPNSATFNSIQYEHFLFYA